MRRLAYIFCFCQLFVTCQPEDFIPIQQGLNQPSDLGIYRIDSSQSDAFCDFRLIPNEKRCWSRNHQVFQDCHYDLLFTRYGNGWTGSDATYSLPLPDGRIMWMFGDTFLGTVKADRSREGAPFLRNSLVIQQGDELKTLYQMKDGQPRAFVSPPREDEWYWPLDATIHQDEIHFMLGRLGSTGSEGNWSFEYRGFDLVILDRFEFSIKSLTPKIIDPDISFGACILEDDTYTYIYGISSRPFQKRAHIARVLGTNLSKTWEFYDGENWLDEPDDFVIQEGVSDQFSMLKDGEKYYLITHEIIFGNRIFIAESDTPTGPFRNKRILYCTPESGGNIFTYNTFAHPELSDSGELRLSYNINSFDFQDIFRDADLYRPRFLKIENWRQR